MVKQINIMSNQANPNRLIRSLIIAFTVIAALFNCVGDKPVSSFEATDEEAIFNVMLIDNNRISSLEILPTDEPDTLGFMESPDTLHPLYWHNVVETEEDFEVIILDHLVETDIGMVYQANVTYMQTWTGTFETLKYNIAADSLERYSKEFTLEGTREAVCQQWGLSNNQRRGWILISIGDAQFISSGADYHFLSELYFDSHPDYDSVFSFNIQPPGDFIEFNPGEELTIRFDFNDDSDLLLMFLPADDSDYQLAEPVSHPDSGYQVVFNMPSQSDLYGQLKFLVVNAGLIDDDYKAFGYSFNYHIQ